MNQMKLDAAKARCLSELLLYQQILTFVQFLSFVQILINKNAKSFPVMVRGGFHLIKESWDTVRHKLKKSSQILLTFIQTEYT